MSIAIGGAADWGSFYNQGPRNTQGREVDAQAAGTPLENDPDHQKKYT